MHLTKTEGAYIAIVSPQPFIFGYCLLIAQGRPSRERARYSVKSGVMSLKPSSVRYFVLFVFIIGMKVDAIIAYYISMLVYLNGYSSSLYIPSKMFKK